MPRSPTELWGAWFLSLRWLIDRRGHWPTAKSWRSGPSGSATSILHMYPTDGRQESFTRRRLGRSYAVISSHDLAMVHPSLTMTSSGRRWKRKDSFATAH